MDRLRCLPPCSHQHEHVTPTGTRHTPTQTPETVIYPIFSGFRNLESLPEGRRQTNGVGVVSLREEAVACPALIKRPVLVEMVMRP